MHLRLSLFGAPTIAVGAASHALNLERRSQLAVYLAFKRGWVGRSELAALLWPDQPAKLAYTNLRKALFRLQSLPWAGHVQQQGSALRFEVDTDVEDFEAALREHRLADALALRRDELLVGFDDDGNEAWSNWLTFERDRLRIAWRGAAHECLAGDVDPVEAVDLAARLVDTDPLDEAALRTYMTWLARAGQGAQARQTYRSYAQRLADELGLEPSADLKSFHDTLGLAPVRAPAARSPAPARDEGFVGRTVELRRIAALLEQDDCRLLSITGPGGVGKTRLARRLIAEHSAQFANGAVFVPLEDMTTAGELGGQLARELHVTLQGAAEPVDQVIEALREREMLLVLDNFEQLTAEAPVVERLLANCPGVKIIVTSRVRLGLADEWLQPIEGLPCPEDEDRDRIEAFDAARLFVRAAQRVHPALAPEAEAAAIVDICRQVEGLPLALELAAAWTRVLPCDQIALELRQGTELLQATDGTHPRRHASIEHVFDQSWRLLSDFERTALARLSVFRGGFTAEAARAVAAAPLPVLGALADKSLLRREDARLFLHPLVQQLAAARLRDGSEATHTAHAAYFNDLLHQLRRPVENGDRDALQRIDREFENCRAAWRWSAAQGAGSVLARSVHALSHYCDHRNRYDEGLQLLREALAQSDRLDDAGVEALLLGKAAHLEYRLDRYPAATATARRGLDRVRAIPNAGAEAQCLKVLGTCSLRLGQLRDAQRYCEQSLKLAPESSDLRHRAAILSSLALVQKALGNYDEALRLSLDALEEQRSLGDVASEALSLNNLAALYIERQQFDTAGEHLTPALELCDRHGLVTTRVYVLANLTGVAMKTGQPAAAEAYARRALEHATAIGNRFVVAFLKLQFARFALARHQHDEARGYLREAMRLAIGIGRPSLLIEGLICFAEILLAQGEFACARAVLQFGLDHPSTGALERDELRRNVDKLPPADEPPLPWPGLTLDELAHRIVIEANLSYAPLLATLNGARQPA